MIRGITFLKTTINGIAISAISVATCIKIQVLCSGKSELKSIVEPNALPIPIASIRRIVSSGARIEFHGVDHRIDLMIASSQPSVSTWDPSALVYVTVGLDMKPGAAAVDDDGNGVVDDRGELGATGTDDRVLTPGDGGYQDAEAGSVMAAVLSRGAMRRVEGDAVIEGPGQVRIDVIDDKHQLVSRIIDLVGK